MINTAWDDVKIDGSSTLPAAEYNTMVTTLKSMEEATVKICKEGANYVARNGATGAIISSNTDFSTVCQAAGDSITGNGVIFIKDPGSNIVPTATVTFTNKEIFVTSDFAKMDFSALNNIVFHFQDTVQYGYKICGISNFRLKGNEASTSQIFAKFSDVRAKVDNLLCTTPDYVYTFVYLYGGNYLSHISNVQGMSKEPIIIQGYGVPLRQANGTLIEHCDVGYMDGDNCIKIVEGVDMCVRDCYLEGAKTGIYASSTGSLFISNNFISVSVAGIDVDSFQSMIIGNYILLMADGAKGIISHAGFYSPTITGNTIYAGAHDNLMGMDLTGMRRGTITGNIFEIDGTSTGSYGIRGAGVSHKLTITGNVFNATSAITGTAIFFDDLYYSTIVGNMFYNWSTPITITTKSLVNIDSNSGYKTMNWGSSTGTGAQQTIAHGLAAMPTLVMLSDKELDAKPYQSATADATNIYILAVINQDYQWYVRV